MGCAEHPDDAVLLVKQFLSSSGLSQRPLLIIPVDMLSKLKGPLMPADRNKLSPKELSEFRSTATKVAAHPWELQRAAGYLRIGYPESKNHAKLPSHCSRPPLASKLKILPVIGCCCTTVEQIVALLRNSRTSNLKASHWLGKNIWNLVPAKRTLCTQNEEKAWPAPMPLSIMSESMFRPDVEVMAAPPPDWGNFAPLPPRIVTLKAKPKAKSEPKPKGEPKTKAKAKGEAKAKGAVKAKAKAKGEAQPGIETIPEVAASKAKAKAKGRPPVPQEGFAPPPPKASAAPPAEPPPPPAVARLGCSKCRNSPRGCAQCKSRLTLV